MREDRIISKLEGAYDFIEFVNDNYPNVLSEWKNKNAVVTSHSSRTSSETGNSGGDPKSHHFWSNKIISSPLITTLN
jgi:hypothetical protein